MKKCIVMQDMHDPANFGKYIACKVPIRLNKYTYPYFGVVASKKYSYMKYKSRIFNAHWCSDTDILNRSLQSDGAEALDSVNYLRYASDKFN